MKFVLSSEEGREDYRSTSLTNMARTDETFLLLVVAVVVGCVSMIPTSDASASLDHIVGGRLGWSLPPNASYYEDWKKNKTFVVGDTLVFMYTSALQNVMQVSKADFDACTDKNIVNWFYTGPTLIKLDKPGPLYYYCGVGTHCESGQKLFINVSSSTGPDPVRDGLPPPAPGSVTSPSSSSSSLSTSFLSPVRVVPFVLLFLMFVVIA